METVLVTGGMGFVGQYVVQSLVGHQFPVVSYNRDYADQTIEGVTLVQGELYDVPRLLQTIERYNVTLLVHTAAMSHPELSIGMPTATVVANIEGTVHVLEAARMTGIRRTVLFSSECVYGHHPGPITEDSPFNALTPYAATKIAGEYLSQVYSSLYGLDIVTLRIVEVYGPKNKMPQILRDIIRSALDKGKFVLETGGDHMCHFVHARDVAECVVRALGTDSRSKVFNITSGEVWSVREAAKMIQRLIKDVTLEIGPGYLPGRIKQGPYSTQRFTQDLGYSPQWTLAKGLDEYVDWLRRNEY